MFLFGLLLWIAHILAHVPYTLVEARAYWLDSQFQQPPLFTMFSLCCALLVVWTIAITAPSTMVRKNQKTGKIVILASFAMTMATIGGVLYKMRMTVLDDSWYLWALENEELESERYYLGRIIEYSLEQCGNVPKPCVTIQLQSGETARAHLPELPNPWSTDVITADLLVGEITGRKAYFEVTDYIPGDPALRRGMFEE